MSKEWYGEDQCGECQHNKYDTREHCYVCSNPESEYYGLRMAYDDVCDEFERKG